ncbi:MAG: hypothetical protein P8L37_05280 [Phycisphaerales bacterium]|nr:hypothetical protein [Phycisphaerales bacterium]
MSQATTTPNVPRLYDDDGDHLIQADKRSSRVVLLPSGNPKEASTDRDRIRIQWGQHLLADLLAGRYRTLVCGVNTEDNTGGIIGMLAELLPTSQWNASSITAHAQMFAESAGNEDMLVLKYDMDAVEVLALLRPKGRDHFALGDLKRGFEKVASMIDSRSERLPCASVSFLGAKSNGLFDDSGNEPSFESVLRTMFEAGYRGDIYPSLGMWELAPTAVWASYPFSDSLKVMRSGGF